MIPSNILPNLEKLKTLLKKTPNATHVYFEREDGQTVDIPIAQAEFNIRQKPKWVLDSLGVSGTRMPGSVNPWPAQKISDIGKSEAQKQVEADKEPEAPVVVPPKPSEEKKDEGTASSGNAASPEAAGNTAPPTPPAGEPVAPVQYRALKNFEHPAGTPHKYRDVLTLTEEEAKAFPADTIKKVD